MTLQAKALACSNTNKYLDFDCLVSYSMDGLES
jgi:hypothetical protein